MRQRAQIATGPILHAPATDNCVFACLVCGTNPCINPSFCIACAAKNRGCHPEGRGGAAVDPRHSRQSGTPQTTIEAIMYTVRARGLLALKEPANIERLSRCDAAAKTEINKRIASLIAAKRIAP
jgi:hypothetical protein